jgi:hypothetical protein
LRRLRRRLWLWFWRLWFRRLLPIVGRLPFLLIPGAPLLGIDKRRFFGRVTRSGDVFMNAIDPEGFDFFTPRGYDKIFTRSRRASSNPL